MKRGLWILLAGLLAGLTGFFISHRPCCIGTIDSTALRTDHSQQSELGWLRSEFKLSEEQFAQVTQLHEAYRPTCKALCERVVASHEKVKKLVDAGSQVTPELRGALQEQAALHVECQSAMLTHLYQTAACMAPEQAKRYLEAMLPHVLEMAMEPQASARGH
jgi:hypothetical protein